MDRLNLKRLNDVEVKEKYQVKISYRFPALDNLDNVHIDRAWGSI
jgi:hypothetical protein